MKLEDLDIYRLAEELSNLLWIIYQRMDWKQQKILGDQWIRATDSIGANIAEGFGRYHYLDKNKFNYNARGSLFEARHWTKLAYERKIISETEYDRLQEKYQMLCKKLNYTIKVTREQNQKVDYQ